MAVVVLRNADDTVYALADRCSHLGGPLSEGDVADGCLTCPGTAAPSVWRTCGT
ncbi:Rieske 2Fe-2S domain-containing protein [Streptomyces sp. NPDC014724]|uniref:Rieske 2Fe-2S domain-containing protein n=1 Tax=unclassified Streptomyces TaxID=2593676 RepID=UPI0036F6724D